ncbi:unnamed protein product [Toxocara canis]|uniref:RxLR effector candidate protein n=1 Tax=Toxocara canis TaxID=6265 RepID=A0A183V9J3_TOXCA|nr:unnamed protein product [Toxocara canis]
MREIFYATTIIGVLAHSMLGVPASVGERAVIEELERGGASSNETAVDVHNKTTNGVWLDIAHPIIVVEALYENSRHRIHEWMHEGFQEDRYTYLVTTSALTGAVSAFITLMLFYFLYALMQKCRSKSRQHKIADIARQLKDGKNPFDAKDEDSNKGLV